MRAVWISRHGRYQGGDREMAAVMIGMTWTKKHISYLMLRPPLLTTVCKEQRRIQNDRGRERKQAGWGLLSVSLFVRVKKRALCSQVSYALVTMPEGRSGGGGGGGGWVWRQQGRVDRLSYLLSAALSDHFDTAPWSHRCAWRTPPHTEWPLLFW